MTATVEKVGARISSHKAKISLWRCPRREPLVCRSTRRRLTVPIRWSRTWNIKIRTAKSTRLVEHLAADVKSGRNTQAQSDARLKAFDAQPADGIDGPGFGRGPGGHGGFGGPGGPGRGAPRAGLNG